MMLTRRRLVTYCSMFSAESGKSGCWMLYSMMLRAVLLRSENKVFRARVVVKSMMCSMFAANSRAEVTSSPSAKYGRRIFATCFWVARCGELESAVASARLPRISVESSSSPSKGMEARVSRYC
jgi:hypothetical protein